MRKLRRTYARVVELVDTPDLKSCDPQGSCRFNSGPGHLATSVAFFMPFFVYILYSEKLDRFYTGTTDNVQRRLQEHNSTMYPDSFSAKGILWTLFLEISCSSSQQAYDLEGFIKKMKSKVFIKRLKEQPKIIEDLLAKFK